MMVDFQKFLIINLFLIPLLNINFAYSKTPDKGGGAAGQLFHTDGANMPENIVHRSLLVPKAT